MSGEPWYKDGLRFSCSQCGDCCTGAPGFVWVNNDEVAEMAAALGMSNVSEFEHAYVRSVGIRRSLKEFDNGDCVFLDPETRGCRVYTARPRQCRTWPFWDSNLRSRRAWEATCEACPGSGKGELHALEDIETLRKQIRI